MKNCPICALELINVDIGGKLRIACANCDFVHWDNPKPVTATVVPMESGIVLVKRACFPYIDDWCLPGGFIEATEHPVEAAIREVQEETGLLVEVDRLLDACAPGRGINVIILFYAAKPASGLLVPGDDASDVGVFSKNDLPENIAFDLHRQIINRWFDLSINP